MAEYSGCVSSIHHLIITAKLTSLAYPWLSSYPVRYKSTRQWRDKNLWHFNNRLCEGHSIILDKLMVKPVRFSPTQSQTYIPQGFFTRSITNFHLTLLVLGMPHVKHGIRSGLSITYSRLELKLKNDSHSLLIRQNEKLRKCIHVHKGRNKH